MSGWDILTYSRFTTSYESDHIEELLQGKKLPRHPRAHILHGSKYNRKLLMKMKIKVKMVKGSDKLISASGDPIWRLTYRIKREG
jgi:hypothetical protein